MDTPPPPLPSPQTLADLLTAVTALPPAWLPIVLTAVQARLLPPIVSFVGRSGTGKTTFLTNLLPELRRRGLRVGVVKHHAHPTPFDTPGKDTFRLAEAGAALVIGISPVETAVFRRTTESADLNAILAREAAGLDLIVTEGLRQGSYPKIELHRSERSPELLCRPDELLALVSDIRWPWDIPQFDWNAIADIADWLYVWQQRQRDLRASPR
jgi:molybdopterin-guanine dinucleotide biosynthesis protein B